MKRGFLHNPAGAEVLDDNALEQRWGDSAIPDAIRIHDDDRATTAHAETRCFTTLYAIRAEEKALSLQQRREETVKLSTTLIR